MLNRTRPPVFNRFAATGIATVLLWGFGCSREQNGTSEEIRDSEGAVETTLSIHVDAEAREQIGLETAEAQLRPMTRLLRTTGVVGPDETRLARVRALSSGVLTDVLVRRGDRVKEGQPLVVYDNVELGAAEAEYRSAAAKLEQARAEAEVARQALERADRLLEIGGIAPAEEQHRSAALASATATVRTYEAEMANLERKLARFGGSEEMMKELAAGRAVSLGARSTLRAPFRGVVLDVQAVAGETIAPERELAVVADLSTVWIQGDLYERDLSNLLEGRNARIHVDAFPGELFVGRVTYVSDSLDPATRTAKVRCEVKNPDGRLRLEMFARIAIETGDTQELLAVPRQAVQEIDGETTVFVETGRELFEPRPVTLGETDDEWVEVTAGLAPGEYVVTTAALMLKSKLKLGEFAESEENERE